MISSANQLPPDIIREIVKHFSTPLMTCNSRLFPWFLGHVCFIWRVTFLSMKAEFWTVIQIGDQEPTSNATLTPSLDLRLTADIVEFFLERNRDPFSFHFTLTNTNIDGPELQGWARIFRMLVNESHRWSKASVKCSDTSVLQDIVHVQHRLPLLRDLELDLPLVGHQSLGHAWRDIFSRTPSLTRVSLNDLGTFNINWSTLTTLGIWRTDDVSYLISCLAQMTNLVDLSFDGRLPRDQLGQVLLPNLKRLHTRDTQILTLLSAPALELLSLQLQHEVYMSQEIISSFLCRSSCMLSQLEIRCENRETIMEIIRQTTQITHLSIGVGTLDTLADVLHWLASKEDLEVPAPRLRSLTILDTAIMGVNADCEELDALCEFVGARAGGAKNCQNGKMLETVTLDSGEPIPSPWREIIKKVCDSRGVHFMKSGFDDFVTVYTPTNIVDQVRRYMDYPVLFILVATVSYQTVSRLIAWWI